MFETFHEIFGNLILKDTPIPHELEPDSEAITNVNEDELFRETEGLGHPTFPFLAMRLLDPCFAC